MAAALLRRYLDEAGVTATIGSAGLLPGGASAVAEATAELAARDLDLTGHRSRQLDAAQITTATLVIGMTREHVREVLVLDPNARDRAFTLKELVRRGEAVTPPAPEVPVASWLATLAASRTRDDLLGWSATDDVADPVGGPRRGFRRAAAELDDLTQRLATLLARTDTT